MEQDYILAASAGEPALPPVLQQFYDSFKDKTPGEYTMGFGAGVDDMPFGPVTITVNNTRVSVIYSEEKEQQMIILQGYAQATLFNRFYLSGILIGDAVPADTIYITHLTDHLSRTEKEREELEQKKIDEIKIQPSFFAKNYNDPINKAASTNGIYIIRDKFDQVVACETVFQAIGIADFADNIAFGLAIAVNANVNTFTDSLTISVAGSLRLAESERFTIAGEVGIVNGKLNAIEFSIRTKVLLCTEVYFVQGSIGIKGFQEPKIAVSASGGIAIGSEIKIPEGLGVVKKALFPNLSKFHPLELSVRGEINPLRNYYALTGSGLFMGNLAISGSIAYDNGNFDAELKAGTVRNNYLNGSLSADYHLRQNGWNLHGNFNCSIEVDFGKFVGISVSGGVDLLLSSKDYTLSNRQYNRKDLTITVSGMAKVKLLFSFNISVQKTWVFNLSDTQRSAPDLLMRSLSVSDASALENVQDVLVCESKDIVENDLPRLMVSGDVIETKSWQIDEQISNSGLVRIQVAAEYTLVDSSWRLTHSAGETVSVYTSENSEGIVLVQDFTHNYYELLLDTPEVGDWTLEILGDSKNSGGIYMDALMDEKFVTQLEIVEQTDTAIRFRYSAYTGAADDTTVVRLFAEEISADPEVNPYSGIIAYLEETENGEFIWEIPEDFRHNSQYRFYISAASSSAGNVTESNGVEVFLARQNAKLECSWELVYSAADTNTVTAFITVTNTGSESTGYLWEILDSSNNDSVDADSVCTGNSADINAVIASGSGIEIKGNSSVTFQHEFTVTDKLRDNPSSLHLTVTKSADGNTKNENSGNEAENESCTDDADEIMFSAMGSDNCREKTISWQAVNGAVSYVLHYALEGDWEGSGVYVNDIYSTSYVLSVAPGEYAYRVIAMDSDGKAIGTWSAAKEVEVLFKDVQTLNIAANISSERSQVFTLNDGIYDLKGIDLQNFTGTMTLFRNDFVKIGESDGSATLKQTENEILTLTIVNGVLKNPVSKMLLDNGEYFWEWTRAENTGSAYDIAIELSGEVFSAEQKDREIISIGDDTAEMPLISGAYMETLKGEVGFCNKDAIYQYMTDDGGELSLVIKNGTVLDAGVKLNIYVQNSSDGEFDCVKTVNINGGEYNTDSVIIDKLAIKNNFYVQVASLDDGRGEYNTDYNFELSFDAFEDNIQSEDVLVVNGGALRDWIGYRNEEHRYLLQIKSDDRYAVRLNGDAHDAVLKVCEVNGSVIEEKYIGVNGTAYIDDIYLQSGNYFVIVNSADKGEGQFNTDYVLSAYELKTLYSLIDNSDDTLELAASKDSIAFNASVENWLGTGDKADFFKFSPQYTELTSSLLLTVDEKTAQAIKDGALTISCCDRFGQELELKALNRETWNIEKPFAAGEIYIGFSCSQPIEDMAYSFKVSDTVIPVNLSGSDAGVSWDAISGASGYVVEYSQDDFANICRIETVSNRVDFFGLPNGVWQWQVRAIGGGISNSEQFITSGNVTVQKFVSEANGNTDMFFANASGTWETGYAAQHSGILNKWGGTREQVTLAGKNKIASIFEGASDANILLLTDDANGDALFVDDIFTALPGTAAGQQARIAKIDEIRAGNGDDVVDMTSQKFAYTGNGVKIYGGAGDDTIWANNGSNTIFGDAGNDRMVGGNGNDVFAGGSGNDSMHGGNGNDIFTFGSNWGTDSVEQLAGGKITLWFESGSKANWDASTLTYSDGTNSVKVSGVSADDITLKFGDDGSSHYAELSSAGCFAASTGEKIFEDKNSGHLA